jgi:hypothetical protein
MAATSYGLVRDQDDEGCQAGASMDKDLVVNHEVIHIMSPIDSCVNWLQIL